jgi:hypothetical protein
MSTGQVMALVAGAVGLCYMLYVLARVLRSHSFTWKQKVMQSALIVVVPLFGAMIVHAVLRTDAQEPAQKDKNFEKQDIGAL